MLRRAVVAVAIASALASPARAQSVAVVGRAAPDPPIAAADAAGELADAAARAGAAVVTEPYRRARQVLARGAVPEDRLAVFGDAARLADQGWRAYLAVEIEFAASQLVNARRVAERALDLDGGLALYADISLRLGAVHLQLGRAGEAADAFRLAAALDPAREVTMAEFAPEIVEAFAAATAATPARREVRVRSDPAGAAIFVDGAAAGTAPVTVELTEGQHVVVARAPGHRARGQLIPVSAASTEVGVVLDPDPVAAAVAQGNGSLAVGTGERAATTAVAGLLVYGDVDAVVLVASVWRRGAPSLLGQRCVGLPVRCTRVVEVGYAEGAASAAAREVWEDLGAEADTPFPPTLLIDARLTRPDARPGTEVPNGDEPRCRVCRNPWLWVGVGAAAVLATGSAIFLSRDGEQTTIYTGDACEFGACD